MPSAYFLTSENKNQQFIWNMSVPPFHHPHKHTRLNTSPCLKVFPLLDKNLYWDVKQESWFVWKFYQSRPSISTLIRVQDWIHLRVSWYSIVRQKCLSWFKTWKFVWNFLCHVSASRHWQVHKDEYISVCHGIFIVTVIYL